MIEQGQGCVAGLTQRVGRAHLFRAGIQTRCTIATPIRTIVGCIISRRKICRPNFLSRLMEATSSRRLLSLTINSGHEMTRMPILRTSIFASLERPRSSERHVCAYDALIDNSNLALKTSPANPRLLIQASCGRAKRKIFRRLAGFLCWRQRANTKGWGCATGTCTQRLRGPLGALRGTHATSAAPRYSLGTFLEKSCSAFS